MRRASGFSTGALVCGCALAFAACDHHGSGDGPGPVPVAAKATAAASHAPTPPSAAPSADAIDSLSVSELPDESAAPVPSANAPTPPSKVIIDDAQAIGPAGPMTADANGVVMIDRSDELHVAKRAPSSTSLHSERARFAPVSGGPNDFFAVARGPLLLRGKAYWIRDGKLVRRVLDSSTPLEILANDARNGTRVAGADIAGAPAHAVYVTRPKSEDAPPRASLWVEGAGSVAWSPEGAGASSVAAASTGEDLFAIAIDARSAMTPLHGRRVHFKAGKPELAQDVVMWVGASSQTLSEVFASTTPFGVRAFLPIERDVSHFGLVMLELGTEPHMDPKAVWRGYPNGIDVAPVASAAFCGAAFVAYVRPANPAPDAPEVLELAEISEAGLGPPEVVSTARGFSNLSLAAASNSAILAYVADYQTFATTVRCKHQK
ncbi:MAG TPA: hypothetical protein VNW92_10175 [Polyangiaceae bacterium]|nr:hypothetical protein [Polyangiaceae bacterium]